MNALFAAEFGATEELADADQTRTLVSVLLVLRWEARRFHDMKTSLRMPVTLRGSGIETTLRRGDGVSPRRRGAK